MALVNDEDEAVVVRDVAIKKGDRCFCVFHCDCVCLSEIFFSTTRVIHLSDFY